MRPSSAKRAVFLDRDGVINKKALEGSYVLTWEDFEFLPHAREAIKWLNEVGFAVVIVTNQRGIARKRMTETDLDTIHTKMKEALQDVGAKVDAIYACPHEVGAGCGCRKPEPGMLLKAMVEHRLDLKRSWVIGDSMSDIEAGKIVGCRTVLITDHYPGYSSAQTAPDLTAASLIEAVEKIVGRDISTKKKPLRSSVVGLDSENLI